MCLAQGPQRSDAGEARTQGTSVSSQALTTEPLRSLLTHTRIKNVVRIGVLWQNFLDPRMESIFFESVALEKMGSSILITGGHFVQRSKPICDI